MPLTTTTGINIADSFFESKADPDSQSDGQATEDETPRLSETDYPAGGAEQKALDSIGRKIPKGAHVRTIVTVTRQYVQPTEAPSPVATAGDCEYYHFILMTKTRIRKYWSDVGAPPGLLFFDETSAIGFHAAVRFCPNQEPYRCWLGPEWKFDMTGPPPAPPPPKTADWFWLPLDDLPFDRAPASGWNAPPKPPNSDADFFYDRKLVLRPVLPVRYRPCLVVVTYRYAFQVTKWTKDMTSSTTSYEDLDKETEVIYRIPNCPAAPKEVTLKPSDIGSIDAPQEFKSAWIVRSDGTSQAVHAALADDGTFRLSWPGQMTGQFDGARLHVLIPPPGVLADGNQAFARYLHATRPRAVEVHVDGQAEHAENGLLTFRPSRLRVAGIVRT